MNPQRCHQIASVTKRHSRVLRGLAEVRELRVGVTDRVGAAHRDAVHERTSPIQNFVVRVDDAGVARVGAAHRDAVHERTSPIQNFVVRVDDAGVARVGAAHRDAVHERKSPIQNFVVRVDDAGVARRVGQPREGELRVRGTDRVGVGDGRMQYARWPLTKNAQNIGNCSGGHAGSNWIA
jgi:hypothetical protein